MPCKWSWSTRGPGRGGRAETREQPSPLGSHWTFPLALQSASSPNDGRAEPPPPSVDRPVIWLRGGQCEVCNNVVKSFIDQSDSMEDGRVNLSRKRQPTVHGLWQFGELNFYKSCEPVLIWREKSGPHSLHPRHPQARTEQNRHGPLGSAVTNAIRLNEGKSEENAWIGPSGVSSSWLGKDFIWSCQHSSWQLSSFFLPVREKSFLAF